MFASWFFNNELDLDIRYIVLELVEYKGHLPIHTSSSKRVLDMCVCVWDIVKHLYNFVTCGKHTYNLLKVGIKWDITLIILLFNFSSRVIIKLA